MSEQLDHETFDIRDVLSGRTYQTDTKVVHTDAKADYQIFKLNQEIGDLRLRKETAKAKELEKKVEELVKQVSGTALTVNVQAISPDDRNAILEDAYDKYPEETDVLGRGIPSRERDRYFTNKRWAAHITSIESAKGTDTDVTVDKVIALLAVLPEHSLREIGDAIDGLYEGAAAGAEQAAQDAAFSSAASREA